MKFSILHISDLHRDLTNELGNAPLLESLVRDIEQRYAKNDLPILEASLCIVSGDLVYGAKAGSPEFATELTRQYNQANEILVGIADRLFEGDRSRIILVPGNHDVSYNHVLNASQEIAIPSSGAERAYPPPGPMWHSTQFTYPWGEPWYAANSGSITVWQVCARFVRSKLSGVRQVFAVTFHTYSGPIHVPVKYLRPARETCEQCHWPQRFSGDKFLVKTTYKDDEKNTPQKTVMPLKVGGRTWQGAVGIHGRHADQGERIRYISIDDQRQVIPVVYYTDDNGKTVEYVSSDIQATKKQLAAREHRSMDCVDCHNRPTHTFELPENAVNAQMATGLISPELPFIRKKAVELLKADYPDRETARQRIVEGVKTFYRTNYPSVYDSRRALLEQSADTVANIYLRNIFPDMKMTWGVHPNNLGRNDSPGCFRCHDGSHVSTDGQMITNECTACHNSLAVEEQYPQILADLGVK